MSAADQPIAAPPIPAQSATTADGTAYAVYGPPGAPAVVFIHGLGLCRALFAPMLAAFAARYRTVVYDLYGHGDSAPPPRTASLALYSEQIAGLLDTLGIARAHLVGFSIGGMINRRFALDYPARLERLVIWNSPHDRGQHGQAEVEARASTVREQGKMSTLEGAIARWFTPAFIAANPDAINHVTRWRAQSDDEGYAQAAWVLAHGVRELIAPQPPIRAQTLVMTGEHDSGSTPQHMQQIAAEIDGAQMLEVPALKHLGLMEDPDAFAAPTLAFLGKP